MNKERKMCAESQKIPIFRPKPIDFNGGILISHNFSIFWPDREGFKGKSVICHHFVDIFSNLTIGSMNLDDLCNVPFQSSQFAAITRFDARIIERIAQSCTNTPQILRLSNTIRVFSQRIRLNHKILARIIAQTP